MVRVTPDVAWCIVRKNHAYIMKRDNCRTFSKEAYNLKNLHSKKYNGFVPHRVIDVSGTKGKRGVAVSHRTKDKQMKPSKNFAKSLVRRSDQHAYRYIRRLTRGGKCRQDLEMTALARASTILKAQRKATGNKQPPRRKTKKERKAAHAKPAAAVSQ